MTTQECDSRDRRIVENIRTMLQTSPTLRQHATLLEVSIENSAIVIRGNLPSAAMKAELVPAIRQAGVLSQINNCVLVAAGRPGRSAPWSGAARARPGGPR